ncbi:MAG: hypothetical protein LBB75_04590 [Oscillospiraceae bacterium]|jgi:TrmH family RNA methyltransferase|nr:hypothetical protein [Oscillospiraceae bacterium]
MDTKRIYTENAAFQRFETLRSNRAKRHREGVFLVEGVRPINEALRGDWRVQSFLYSFERPLSGWARSLLEGIPADVNYEFPQALMDKLSGRADTSELLAVVHMRGEAPFAHAQNPVFVLFDRPSNKGNLGTLLRSCDAFGVNGLILTGHGVDIYDPEVVRSSMGSFFRAPFLRLSSNEEIEALFARLREEYPGLRLVGTTAHRRRTVSELGLAGPVLFLVGNETGGLGRRLAEQCDILATIPMRPDAAATSFNVSCAATVLLYEAARQRGFP